MAVAWTIEGEAGKAWDASTLTFEQRKIENARFEFKSLDTDTFTFRVSAQTIASETLPDYTQKIVIYRDGVRFFTGHVTNRQVQIDSGKQVCDVTVSGPWWWMERITFTATNTDATGATAERATLAFGTASQGQSLQTSLQAAINRSVDLGVPIAKTTTTSLVATMTTFPRITLNQSTCGQVISELVRCCTDAMTYFDYSQETPSIQITRRRSGLPAGSASTVTFNASTDPITSIDLNPMIELEVSKVDLPYLDRDTLGRYRYQNQSHGTASSPLPKRQIITVSGPELDTFLPVDLFDSYQIQTTTVANSSAFILNTNGTLKSIALQFNLTSLPLTLHLSGTSVSGWSVRSSSTASNSNAYLKYASARPGARLIDSSTGADITSTHVLLTTQNPPVWLAELGINVISAQLTGKFRFNHFWDFYYGADRRVLPSWYESVTWDSAFFGPGVYDRPNSSGGEFQVWWTNFNQNVYAVPNAKAYASLTTIYRPRDYSFVFPPAGLAQFLKEAADFVPYNGTINLTQEDVGASRHTGKTLNISNSMPEFVDMRAMVKSESLVIETGETTITVGQPDRFDYRTLVDRIRKTSQDNIYYV